MIGSTEEICICERFLLEVDASEHGREDFEKRITSLKLGKGSFGAVYLGHEKKTKHPVAVKVVDLNLDTNRMTRDKLSASVLKEIEILESLHDVPNVARILGHCTKGNRIFIIMRYAKKGVLVTMQDLDEMRLKTFRFMKQSRTMTEYRKIKVFKHEKVKDIILQLARTLKFLNDEKGIIHRDLKPENILLNSTGNVVLTDFNLSVKLQDDIRTHVMRQNCGTLLYKAPEVFRNQPYDHKCDIWSLGIILYNLLSNGFFPFRYPEPGKTRGEILDSMGRFFARYEKVPFSPFLWWNFVATEPKDLVSRLLQKDSGSRITYDEIIQHAWLNNGLDSAGRNQNELDMYESIDVTEFPSNITDETFADTEFEEIAKISVQTNKKKTRTSIKAKIMNHSFHNELYSDNSAEGRENAKDDSGETPYFNAAYKSGEDGTFGFLEFSNGSHADEY